jgi:predicted permease
MASIIAALFTIFGIMGFGAFTQKRGLFPPSMALCLNQFVYWVSLPCLLFTQMCTIPMDEGTRALIWGALAASVLCYALFYFVFSRGLSRIEPEATVRTLACTFPNAAFFGLPFIIMVFPGSDDAINANMLCALLYTVVSITADVSLELHRSRRMAESPAPEESAPGAPAFSRSATARRILRELARNPMLQSSALGLLLGFAGVRPPEAFLRMTSMLGSTCAPCALFSMGMVLWAQLSGRLGLAQLRRSVAPLALVALGKLLLYPLAAFFVMRLFGCTGDLLAAATVTFAMPVAVMVYILAERSGSCAAEASLSVVVTTVLSIATLPVVMLGLHLAGAF